MSVPKGSLSRREVLRLMGTGLGSGVLVTVLPPIPLAPHAPDLTALTTRKPILITDDSDLSLAFYAEFFTLFNLHCITIEDAEEALHIAQTQPVSMVISDINKPKMSGFELLQQLRADYRTRHLPMFFISADYRVYSDFTAEQMGAAGYLFKPVRPTTLLEETRRILYTTL